MGEHRHVSTIGRSGRMRAEGLATYPTLLLVTTLVAGCGSDAPSQATGAATSPSAAAAAAPPGTDIWLADLTRRSDGALTLGEPVDVTPRPGYDNQPSFLPDGSGFWYTAADSTGQTDIWLHDMANGANHRITSTTPESEYSATYLGVGGGFSVVRVETDSTQRLWRFDMNGSNPSLLLPDVAPVGYQAWADDHEVVMYILGDPATLAVGDVSTGATRTVARDVGRSIQRIPGATDVSFVQRIGKDSTEIRRLNVRDGTSTLLAPGIQGTEDHAWTPDGSLLQAHGAILYMWRADAGAWAPVADLSSEDLTLSRIAVSPDGTRIALVAEER
ncbi:MAG: hypothetical protein LJF04_11950 [Gemmatimonadetes bacterium]|nr:hypothetical protein [Gemmatimonadota bacterium]